MFQVLKSIKFGCLKIWIAFNISFLSLFMLFRDLIISNISGETFFTSLQIDLKKNCFSILNSFQLGVWKKSIYIIRCNFYFELRRTKDQKISLKCLFQIFDFSFLTVICFYWHHFRTLVSDHEKYPKSEAYFTD